MKPSNGTPDPVALAVAQAAQNAVHHSTIILFGSRAASTHRPDSDVDLMLVYRQSPIAEQSRAQKAVKAHLHQYPPHLRVDIVPMELRDFNYCRRANNHVAAQALARIHRWTRMDGVRTVEGGEGVTGAMIGLEFG